MACWGVLLAAAVACHRSQPLDQSAAVAPVPVASQSAESVAARPAASGATVQPVMLPRSQDRRATLAVMYFNNNSLVDRASYDALRVGIADVLITDLAGNREIRVVERDQLQKLLEEGDLAKTGRVEQETAVRIGKVLGAQHMIFGGFLIDRRGTLRLDARAVHVETSRIVHVESVTGQSEDVMSVIEDLAGRLNRGLKLIPASSPGPAPKPKGDAPAAGRWAALMVYSRALVQDDLRNVETARGLYRQFLTDTPATFAVDQRRRAEERLRALGGGN